MMRKVFASLLLLVLAATAHAQLVVGSAGPVAGSGGLLKTSSSAGASLSIAGAIDGTTVNITSVGSVDWAAWGTATTGASPGDHKTGGGNITGAFTGNLGNYTNDSRTITWSDGTPTASASNQNGIYQSNASGTFTITAPAGTTTRTLKLYLGVFNCSATNVHASLSDGSATAVDYNGLVNGSGFSDGVVTITYAAGSASQTLTVVFTLTTGTGNISLQAAALQ
jgi:hypothetical protein